MCLSLDKARCVDNAQLAREVEKLFVNSIKLRTELPHLAENLEWRVLHCEEDLFTFYQVHGELPPEFDYRERKVLEFLLDGAHISRTDEVRHQFNRRAPLLYDGDRTVVIRSNGWMAPTRRRRLSRGENHPEGDPENENSRYLDLCRYWRDHPIRFDLR